MEQKSAFDSFELEVGDEIKGYLNECSRWGYFLSIIGFIGIAFMIGLALFMSFALGTDTFGNANPYAGLGFSTAYFGLIYGAMAVLYFFPVYYLFNFSRKMKSALSNKNNDDFVSAFSNLKSQYKFMGIFTIVIISIYVLIFIFGMFATMGLF